MLPNTFFPLLPFFHRMLLPQVPRDPRCLAIDEDLTPAQDGRARDQVGVDGTGQIRRLLLHVGCKGEDEE